jgi:hypothetical protein
MTFGIGNLVALIGIAISIIFAIVFGLSDPAAGVLWRDARAPWGRRQKALRRLEMHQPLGSAADTFSLEESQLRSLVLTLR